MTKKVFGNSFQKKLFISILIIASLLFISFFLIFYFLLRILDSRYIASTAPSSNLNILKCESSNNLWSNCYRSDSHLSFEYPSSWFYKTSETLSSEDTQFGPLNPVSGKNQAVILYITEYKNETDAYSKVKNNFVPINGIGGETTLNGLHANINPDGKSIIFGYKNLTYLFVLYDFNSPTNTITTQEAKSSFNHIIQSVKIESKIF